jgi:hypothetical protein
MWQPIVVAGILALALCACGGGSCDGPQAQPSEPDARPFTRSPDSPYTAGAVWSDAAAQAQITDTCSENRSRDSVRFCVEQLMQGLGAPPEAIDFFLETGHWLSGFAGSPGSVKAGRVIPAAEPHAPPQLAFLAGHPKLQLLAGTFQQAFPRQADTEPWPFERDPMYPRLFDAAKLKFQNADDPLLLRHFNIAELESHANVQAGRQEFIVQIGIHNFCEACGVGVAARYSFIFEADGKLSESIFLSICQGRMVTRDVEGIGRVSFHEFSIKKARAGGVEEPYLLTVPGLTACPAHIEL